MAEVKVKLLADVADLTKTAEDATSSIANKKTTVKVDADTQPFLDGIKKALAEAEQLQATLQTNTNAIHAEGSDAKKLGALGSDKAGMSDKQLLDMLKASQQQNSKTSDALKKVIEELSRSIEQMAKRSGSGEGGNPGQGGGGPSNSGVLGLLLKVMGGGSGAGPGQTPEIGDMLSRYIGGGNGIMSMLSAIPGLGMMTKLLTGAGLVGSIVQAGQKHTEVMNEARDQAFADTAAAYDTYGSVMAYPGEQMGTMSYYKGAYDSIRLGEKYGYDMDTVLGAAETYMGEGGWNGLENHNQDMETIMSQARATGTDATRIAALAGTAERIGGDAGNSLNMLSRSIETTGMQGREDEMVDVLNNIYEELGLVNSTISEEAVGNELNLMNRLATLDSNMTGERAKSAIDSIEDFTSSDNMGIMVAAGYGTGEYTGVEGWNKLRRMQLEDPEAFMERAIKGMAETGANREQILYALDRNGVGDINNNGLVVDAILNGENYVGPDMTDQAANAAAGEQYRGVRNQDAEASGANAAAVSSFIDRNNKSVTGNDETAQYEAHINDMRNAGAKDKSHLGYWDSVNADWFKDSLNRDAFAGMGRATSTENLDDNATGMGADASNTYAESSGYFAQTPAQSSYDAESPLSLQAAPARSSVDDYMRSESALTRVDGDGLSAPDSATQSDMSAMTLAGYGTEYTGIDGWNKLRQMQREDPEGYLERVIKGAASARAGTNDIAYMSDWGGDIAGNPEAVDAILGEGNTGASDINDSFSPLAARPADSALNHPVSAERSELMLRSAADETGEEPIAKTGTDRDYLDALARNTEAIEEQTDALEAAKSSDALAFSSSAQSSLTSESVENPFSNNSRVLGSKWTAGANNIPAQVAQAVQNVADIATGAMESLMNGDAAQIGADTQTTGDQKAASADAVSQIASLGADAIANVASQTSVIKEDDGSVTVSGSISGSHASGKDRIPYDGYLAMLHRDEAVLSAPDAQLYREGRYEELDGASGSEWARRFVQRGMENAGPLESLSGMESDWDPSAPYNAMKGLGGGDWAQAFLASASEPAGSSMELKGGDININITVSGSIDGMDVGMQSQIVQAVREQISAAKMQDMLAYGQTRRQAW